MDWVMKLVRLRGRRKYRNTTNPPAPANKQTPPPQTSQGRLDGAGGGTVATTVGSAGDSTDVEVANDTGTVSEGAMVGSAEDSTAGDSTKGASGLACEMLA